MKDWKAEMPWVIRLNRIAGLIIGTVTFQNLVHGPAPSISAAS